ncbi:MAG: Holliday junction resolvase RuvX [Ignavibacteria bacterium]|nr:Holliday junction resolvase RuvX [Ignavibacteria bacterium]
MGRILGIDFGVKRIGLSISDPTKTLASPLPTIQNNDKTFNLILDIIKKNDVEKIVIGYPINMDGSKSELCELVDKFINQLLKKIEIEIIKRDERLTSYIAYQQIIESVSSKKKRRDKSLIDQFSARIILQEYLDEIKNNN